MFCRARVVDGFPLPFPIHNARSFHSGRCEVPNLLLHISSKRSGRRGRLQRDCNPLVWAHGTGKHNAMKADDIFADFELLDDWEDRYRYVIELGRELEPLPEAARTPANKVRGCVSQVWLASNVQRSDDGKTRLHFVGDSDALIVKGLIAILLSIYSGRTPDEILAIDAQAIFDRLGLREHLTPQRSNGLSAMVERIRADARAAAQTATLLH